MRYDNGFTWLQSPEAAQRLMDQQLQACWPVLLGDLARRVNPFHAEMFQALPIDYYWTTFQAEWATDILFRDRAALARLYPKLVHHGLVTFQSPDVMRFLGHNIAPSGSVPHGLKVEVMSDMKQRPEGVRIKHRLGSNSLKMYDKGGVPFWGLAPFSGSRRRSTIRRRSSPSAARRASPGRKSVGARCARGLPTSTG